MKPPAFWSDPAAWQGKVLTPLAKVYDIARQTRSAWTHPFIPDPQTPVLCVGNVSVGGVGKSPTVQALATLAHDLFIPCTITIRGYGGRLKGPTRVDPARHTALDVGDEALMLAQTASVWQAHQRVVGVRAAAWELRRGLILMDDGHQNPTIQKTTTVMVIDEGAGFGNGRLLPAGPLREPILSGLRAASLIVSIADPAGAIAPTLPGLLTQADRPVIRARFVVPDHVCTSLAALPDPHVDVMAGIGRPEKFLATVRSLGLKIHRTHIFTDHHPFSRDELMSIISTSSRPVLTTEKDAMRLPPDLKDRFTVIPVRLKFGSEAPVRRLLTDLMSKTGLSPLPGL